MRRLIALLVVVLALLAAGPAFAHASLLASLPADGAIVAAAPAELTLTFNEPVSPTEMHLIGPGDTATTLGGPTLTGDTVRMAVGGGLGKGSYALSWRVISADGHPVGGTVEFSVGRPSAGGEPVVAEAVDWPVAIGIWVSRVLTYGGMFIGIGGAAFASWIGRRRASGGVTIALCIGLLALLPDLVFQGLDALGLPIGEALTGAVWSAGLEASFGVFLGTAALAVGLAFAGTRAEGRLARALTLAALAATGVAFAATGHASAADPQWLARPAVFLHTACVTLWIGSLLPLAGLLRGDAEAALPALERFSAIIPIVIAVLLAAGITLATVQIGQPAEVLKSAYGRVFLGKMGLVVCLLGLGAYNRWRLTTPARLGAARLRRRLAAIIALELVLSCLVLGVVALWRFTPPPRALLEAAAMPLTASIEQRDGMADLTFTPGGAGPVSVGISIFDAAMQPLAAQQLTLDFSNKDKGIQPIERQAARQPDGSWRVDSLVLPAGGTWQVEIDALISTFKMVTLEGEVKLRP